MAVINNFKSQLDEARISVLPEKLDGPREYMNRTRRMGFLQDCVKAFSKFLIESLTRRYNACRSKLLEHASEITYKDDYVYEWPTGMYNIPSAEKMNEAIQMLEDGQYTQFIKDRYAIDQVLKALLNDVEPHPDKIDGYKFSELVSVLMEAHAFGPNDAIPGPSLITTPEEALRYAAVFGLEEEVEEAMREGLSPRDAVLEWCK